MILEPDKRLSKCFYYSKLSGSLQCCGHDAVVKAMDKAEAEAYLRGLKECQEMYVACGLDSFEKWLQKRIKEATGGGG